MLTQVTAPESYPVSLADIKSHLRIDASTEDDLLTVYLQAATGWLETETQRAYVQQTWKYQLDAFSDRIYLPLPPLVSVTHVKYYDSENVQQTLSSSNYHVVTGAKAQGYVEKMSTVSWPTTYDRPDAVEIQYACGYSTIPPQAVHAIKLLVGGYYEEREAQGYTQAKDNPALDRLVSQLRSGEYH